MVAVAPAAGGCLAPLRSGSNARPPMLACIALKLPPAACLKPLTSDLCEVVSHSENIGLMYAEHDADCSQR